MSEYYQFRDETGTAIDYYELVNDNNELCKENEQLKSQLQQKENIIKEIRKYIEENLFKDDNDCGCWWYGFDYYKEAKKDLLEILDKEDINV